MAKRYYAVKKGLVPGIYTKWSECQQSINGFSGAVYKGFDSKIDAENFLNEDNNDNSASKIDSKVSRIYTLSEALAYVNGSCNQKTKEYACGVVIFHENGEEHFNSKFNSRELTETCSFAGEIEGAKLAMRFCVENNIHSLDLFYNYEGIEKWCTGAWKTTKENSKAYRKYYDSIKGFLTVNFSKNSGHLNNKYNDLAEDLSKSALGLLDDSSKIAIRENGIVANGIKENDVKAIFELLHEDFESLTINESSIPYGIRYELKINNPTNQKLIINSYKEKNKLWICGRKEDLFNRLTLYIVELLETDKIPEFLNTVHNVVIDKDIVQTEFEDLFPNSYNKIPSELNNYLHQAVYNLHLSGEMYVANYLVEPALRPLEGMLKLALLENGFPIRKEDSIQDSFFVFKEKYGKYVVKEQYINDDHSQKLLDYLCRCYTYYRNYRHTMFHWDNPMEGRDTTRIIKTVEEAATIIRDIISLIDEYYTL